MKGFNHIPYGLWLHSFLSIYVVIYWWLRKVIGGHRRLWAAIGTPDAQYGGQGQKLSHRAQPCASQGIWFARVIPNPYQKTAQRKKKVRSKQGVPLISKNVRFFW
jgi:hypothetical protein